MRALDVHATGPLALVQDLGRPGHAALGVGRSGAADRAALRLANRLLGNDDGAAAVETVLGGLVVRAVGDLLVAVTGAPGPVTVDGRTAATHAVLPVRDGQRLELDLPPRGLWSYLAVRGGVDVPAVLGSRSTDTLSGIGPPPVTAGTRLPVGPAPTLFPVTDAAPPVHDLTRRPLLLRIAPGPRADWVADPDVLTRAVWTVSGHSDRIGTRLDGPAVERAPHLRDAELPSEGVVRGALQIPAGGRPVLFGPDHPVTGGYPVVAVVVDADTDAAAHLRPGDQVRFTPVRRPR